MTQEASKEVAIAGNVMAKRARFAVFGAAPDTANMGVSALFISVLTGIAARLGNAEFVVFDNGLGQRAGWLDVPGGGSVSYMRFGARGGRRYYRPENLAAMAFAAKLGQVGSLLNRAIALIDSCDAVLDVSGGDSFSDIYGIRRFEAVYLPKAVAKERGKPLILLPQTYGPYKAPEVRLRAAEITRCAHMAWARDVESFGALQQLLGDEYDERRHRSGVDVAFGLEPSPAGHLLDDRLMAWVEDQCRDFPLIGFNVSGLLYNKDDGGARDFGLKADYRQTVVEVMRNLLRSGSGRVVLIPHVMDPVGHYESDLAACESVKGQLPELADRIVVSPANLNASQVKWLIGRMDWFCGTRMHSTIAGLSSGVPTAAISYSDKTLGVFKTCGQEKSVFDPRKLSGAEIARDLVSSYLARHETRTSLAEALPQVKEALDSQFNVIAHELAGLVEGRSA